MRTLAQWHIWLGWLVGVPIVMWLASGLFMTLRPIEEVRGEHLRLKLPRPRWSCPAAPSPRPEPGSRRYAW